MLGFLEFLSFRSHLQRSIKRWKKNRTTSFKGSLQSEDFNLQNGLVLDEMDLVTKKFS